MKPNLSRQSSSLASKKITNWAELHRWQPMRALLLFLAISATLSSAQTFKKFVDFKASNGAYPLGVLVQGRDGNFYGTTEQGGENTFGTVFKMTPSGTITTIYNFCSATGCTDGSFPNAGLVLGNDGNFYGTTFFGGENYYGSCSTGCGTIFKITPTGTLTTVYTPSAPKAIVVTECIRPRLCTWPAMAIYMGQRKGAGLTVSVLSSKSSPRA